MKRVLALMLALMLAIPGIAFSEDASAGEIAVSDAAELEDAAIDGLSINGADFFGGGSGILTLEICSMTGLMPAL